MLFKKITLSVFLSILFCFMVSLSFASDEALIEGLSRAAHGQVNVSIHSGTGKIRFLAAAAGGSMPQLSFVAPDTDAESAARTFLAAYGSLFGIREQEQELTVKKVRERSVKFRQVYNGIPVIAGELVVNLDLKRNVRSINGEISPDINLSTTPALSAKEAKGKALAVVSKRHGITKSELSVTDKELSIFNPMLIGHDDRNTNYLVWRIEVKSRNGMVREFVLIDAMTGMTHLSFNQVDAARNRAVYDNANNPYYGLPGKGPVRTEGGPASATKDVNDAYDFLGNTYDFYLTNHGRDSIDGGGMSLIATVRYCDPDLPPKYCPYPNAFWNGEQMVFGEGFAAADDVVAHELTHGVTERESALFYYMQSGAINESLSDVWGEFIDLTNFRGTDVPNKRWLIGEDIPGVGAIRNMMKPPRFNDPDSMLSTYYYCKSGDNGGVHTNGGVNNKATYLMVDGGTFNGYSTTGVSGASELEKIQKVAKLYYRVQTNYLTSGSDFQDLADALIQACADLESSIPQVMTAADCIAVETAIAAVHMRSLPSKCRNSDVPLCSDGNSADIFFDNMENTASGNWTHAALQGWDEWYYPQIPNSWGFDATYATSGIYNIWGYNDYTASDYYIAMTSSKGPLPGNSFMVFKHAYEFEYGKLVGQPYMYYFDGGILEYSTNGGSTWNDASGMFVINGYDGKIFTKFGNPLGGRSAFRGSSHGYITSKLDLSTLTGANVRFRFRIGTDNDIGSLGWFIDDVRLYTCSTPAPTAIALESPAGGEVFANGDTVNIQWKGPANLAYVNLLYTVDGATWKKIDSNITGNSYLWVLPLQVNNITKAKVKVVGFNDRDSSIGSAASTSFAIEVVRLISPNGTEAWNEGSDQAVTWVANTTKSPVTTVKLSFSTDNGLTWVPIPTDNVNDGSQNWTLPLVKGDKSKSRLKIILKDASGNTVGKDISDAAFTIKNL